jgi:hypothetical protein
MKSIKHQLYDQLKYPLNYQLWLQLYKQFDDQFHYRLNSQLWDQLYHQLVVGQLLDQLHERIKNENGSSADVLK